ncbi:MAG TPA: ACT domain-containing protein, partial [Motiliproteus sp.]
TEVGHRCRGAKINGRIVPLTSKVKTGDQVEILTSKTGGPSRDWMNPNLGYITSSRGRAKIRHWFKEQARDQNLMAGRQIAERELKRMAFTGISYDELAQRLQFDDTDEMFVALGAGDLRVSQLVGAIQRQPDGHPIDDQLNLDLIPSGRERERRGKAESVTICGVGNLLTTIASCCKPVPGDDIVGYITQGRGVSIHRQDCLNALQLKEVEHERIIEVNWGEEAGSNYTVDIRIDAYDRHGLLRDIMVVMANEKINVLAVNTRSDKSLSTAGLLITLEINRLEDLGRLMDKISQLPNIIDVHRQLPGH